MRLSGTARGIWSRTASIVSAFVASSLLLAAPTRASRPAQPTPAEAFPEGAGKDVMLRVCGNCHGPETVAQSLRTRQEWSDVIDQMSRFGAEATDSEFDQILGYLFKFYSPIQINKAPAGDLQAQLDVSSDVAEAIVRVRQEKGLFKAIDDSKPAPGLDWAKVEARKIRFNF